MSAKVTWFIGIALPRLEDQPRIDYSDNIRPEEIAPSLRLIADLIDEGRIPLIPSRSCCK